MAKKLLSNERKVELYQQLVVEMTNYQDLIISDYEETAQIASIHGWKCKRVNEGILQREKISELVDKLKY